MVNVKPIMEEIAVAGGGRDLTRGFVRNDLVYPQDRVLQAKGYDYQLYESVLSDDQVQATFQQRRLAVTAREWEVVPGGTGRADKMAAEFLKEQLDHIRWDAVTAKMLFGVFYGYSVSECLWARDGARIVFDGVKVRKQRRFRFDAEGRPRLLTIANPQGEALPERKFWTFATGADNDDEPYGLGLAHWLYWPVYFKRNGLKFWLIFLEKLGMPTVKGEYPPGATDDDKRKLIEALAAIQTDSAIAVPQGMVVGLLEAARSSTPDYVSLHDKMNAAISKVVVGQTMTTDDGSSQSQANVHMDVRQDLVKADADLINESFNQGPVRWLTEWNFPGAASPKVWRRIEDAPDLDAQATRDKTIHDMGFKPSLRYIQDSYGGEWVERAMAPGPAIGADMPDAAAFAEGSGATDAIDVLVRRAIAEDGWQKVMEPVAGPVRRALEEAQSLEQFRDGLAELLKDMDAGDLIELLARTLFAARLAGEAGAPIADSQG